jgi:hypothetical protein
MSENKVLSDMILSASTVTATIDAPIEKIDIADWLLNLPDKEYQRCAPTTRSVQARRKEYLL